MQNAKPFSHNFTSYKAEIICFINSFDQQNWDFIFQILRVVGLFGKKLICSPGGGCGIFKDRDQRSIFFGFEFGKFVFWG